MESYLGIDIGTSAVKAVLVDSAQRVLAVAACPLAQHHPRPGWSEQDPEDWWRATKDVAAGIAGQARDAWRRVRAIGLSGQMHGLVALDSGHAVLRPAILWNDARAAEEAAELAALPDVVATAGVLPMAGLTAPKALWLRRHEPELFARLACILLPKDYVRLRLTGERLTDVSDAAGTLWLDQASRRWSPRLVEASGLRLDQLPPIVEGPAPAGLVRAQIARDLGFAEPPLVVGGGGDASLGAIGIGAIADGDGFLSIGTSAQYVVSRDRYVAHNPTGMIHAFAQALPGRWSQTAALLNGASCFAWFAGLFPEHGIETLFREAADGFTGPGDILFLPYLTGERTPHNNPLARGLFAGLTHGADRRRLFQAVLEGVALSLADAQDCLRAGGAEAERPAVIGGGSRSRFFAGLLAAALGKSLVLYDGAERGPAFGAARLARLGHTGEDPRAVCVRPSVREIVAPRPDLVEAYARRLPIFRALYAQAGRGPT